MSEVYVLALFPHGIGPELGSSPPLLFMAAAVHVTLDYMDVDIRWRILINKKLMCGFGVRIIELIGN